MKKLLLTALAVGLLWVGLTGSAGASLINNEGFEAGWTGGSHTGPGYVYHPVGSDIAWTFAGGAGVSQSNTAWHGVAQEGNQFAFLQKTSSISQDFSLTGRSDVSLDFYWALRPRYASGQQVAISVDGFQLEVLDINTTTWTNKVLDLGTLSAGTHSLEFAGLYVGGNDTSAFIDNIQLDYTLNPTPEPATMILFGFGLLGLAGITRRKK